MSFFISILILVSLTYILFFEIKRKSESFWAFIFFYQHIPLIIFERLSNEIYGLIYFTLMLVFYLFKNQKIILSKFNIINPISLSLLLFTIALLLHYYIIGIHEDNIRGFELFYRYFLLNFPIFLIIIFTFRITDKFLIEFQSGILIHGALFLLTIYFVSGLALIDDIQRSDFRETMRISPLLAANISAVITITAMFRLFKNNNIWGHISSFLIIVASSTLMILTASRAALIFMVLSIIVYFVIARHKITTKLAGLFIFALIFASGTAFVLISEHSILDRLLALQRYDEMLRYTRLELAYDIIKSFNMGYFGLGPSGFGYTTKLGYPHNYVVEMIVDYGLLGFVSVLFLIFFSSVYSVKLIISGNRYFEYFGILFLYLFMATLTSGDVVTARFMQFSGLILSLIYYKRSELTSKLIYRIN